MASVDQGPPRDALALDPGLGRAAARPLVKDFTVEVRLGLHVGRDKFHAPILSNHCCVFQGFVGSPASGRLQPLRRSRRRRARWRNSQPFGVPLDREGPRFF
jgi:hypothetical protein